MNLNTAREIAARIWCDPDYEHVEMNVDLAEKIAVILLNNATQQQQGFPATAHQDAPGSTI